MGRGYADAADEAKNVGVLDPENVTEREVQQQMERFLNLENPEKSGARELVEKTTEAAMDQTVQFAEGGGRAGKRENLTTWTDRWGNIMAQNESTGTRKKLVDSSNV